MYTCSKSLLLAHPEIGHIMVSFEKIEKGEFNYMGFDGNGNAFYIVASGSVHEIFDANIEKTISIDELLCFSKVLITKNNEIFSLWGFSFDEIGLSNDNIFPFETLHFDKEIFIIKNNYKFSLYYIGEGVNGDFDNSDPDDTPLLRYSIDEWHDGAWQSIENTSYCTQLPCSINLITAYAALEHIADKVIPFFNSNSSHKRICEQMSWIHEKLVEYSPQKKV